MIIALGLLLVAAAPPSTKADETCAATKFTLNKPVAAPQPKPEPKKVETAKASPPQPKADKTKIGDCGPKKAG
jgi:hypothetical protein